MAEMIRVRLGSKPPRYLDATDGKRQTLYVDVAESGFAEFHARMRYAGPRMVGATEHRYLLSAIETPEGRRPETWAEPSAYVRAYGVDRYEGAREMQRMERDRELSSPGLGLRP